MVECEIQDLMPKNFERDLTEENGGRVILKGIVQFIVARRHKHRQGGWEFFSKDKLNKIVTAVQVACATHKNRCAVALEYANMWGQITILGFNMQYWGLIKSFRALIETYPSNRFEYYTFPKAGLINKFATTVLLNNDFCYLSSEHVVQNLMDRNPVLRGKVRAVEQKFFTQSDKDRNGSSMD